MRPLLLSLMVLAVSPIGCAGTAARLSAYFDCKAATHAARLEARQLRLDAIKEENAMELEAIRAEHQAALSALKSQRSHELACLRASTEKENCALKSQYDESIRTNLGLDLDQRLSVGQVQVNMDELRSLLTERDRLHAEQMEVYNALRDNQRKAQIEQWKPQVNGPTCTCAQPPGFLCPSPTCDAPHPCACCQQCGLPMRPQLSSDCAGMRPFREGPMKPIQQPLSPAEIPLMVPVKLELGVTNSYVNDSRVRRMPPAMLPQKSGCCETEQCIPPGPIPPAASIQKPSFPNVAKSKSSEQAQPAVYEKDEE